jgi:archaellin
MIILIALFVIAWVAASVLGTMAYFLGEQSKPIHERNWRSKSFEQLSESITGQAINYSTRVPAFSDLDAYNSSILPNA